MKRKHSFYLAPVSFVKLFFSLLFLNFKCAFRNKSVHRSIILSFMLNSKERVRLRQGFGFKCGGIRNFLKTLLVRFLSPYKNRYKAALEVKFTWMTVSSIEILKNTLFIHFWTFFSSFFIYFKFISVFCSFADERTFFFVKCLHRFLFKLVYPSDWKVKYCSCTYHSTAWKYFLCASKEMFEYVFLLFATLYLLNGFFSVKRTWTNHWAASCITFLLEWYFYEINPSFTLFFKVRKFGLKPGGIFFLTLSHVCIYICHV